MKSWSVTIQIKATKLYFPLVLCIMMYNVSLAFKSVKEIFKRGHSSESYWAVPQSCGAPVCDFLANEFVIFF